MGDSKMIKDDLIKLKHTRTFLKVRSDMVRQAKEEFEVQNKKLIESITKAKEEQDALIKSIHIEALLSYSVDSNNDIGYGIKVIKKKIWEYDADKALEWAIDHRLALALDVKIFKELAKAHVVAKTPFDFVKINEEPSVTIPGKIEIGED